MISLKKIELHCHFDGSLNPVLAEYLVGPSVRDKLICNGNGNLAEYLTNFELPIQLLQTRENLTNFARRLAKDLVTDEVIYAEIRFCPLLHLQEDLTPVEVIQAVLEGLQQVPEVKTNLILCMMRNLSFADNVEVINLANAFKGRGVVAIDLAGDEAAQTNAGPEFAELFKRASINGIPFTIHAGEADCFSGVNEAIKLGAKRIGHGVRAIESEYTVQQLVKRHIPLEVCLKSNLDTGIYPIISEHPVRKLFDAGAMVTINTDNRTISDTSLEKEYRILRKKFGFTDEDFLHLNLNAAIASFANDATKVQLCQDLLVDYARRHRNYGRLEM